MNNTELCKIGDIEYTCDNCPINSKGVAGVVSKELMNKYGLCSPTDLRNDDMMMLNILKLGTR